MGMLTGYSVSVRRTYSVTSRILDNNHRTRYLHLLSTIPPARITCIPCTIRRTSAGTS